MAPATSLLPGQRQYLAGVVPHARIQSWSQRLKPSLAAWSRGRVESSRSQSLSTSAPITRRNGDLVPQVPGDCFGHGAGEQPNADACDIRTQLRRNLVHPGLSPSQVVGRLPGLAEKEGARGHLALLVTRTARSIRSFRRQSASHLQTWSSRPSSWLWMSGTLPVSPDGRF